MRKRIFLYVFMVFALFFIWGNSFLGAGSYVLSSGLKNLLGINELLLRKLAHVIEYTALGAILTLTFGKAKRKCLLILCCGLAAAVIDELIQTLSVYRHPSPFDVLLDLCGVALGIMLTRIPDVLKCTSDAQKGEMR